MPRFMLPHLLLRRTPLHPAAPEPEMRAAIRLAPDRGTKGGRPVAMLRHPPTGPFIGQQIHVQDALAAARTHHRGLFLETVFPHNVERAPLKPPWQQILDDNRPVRRDEPPMTPLAGTLKQYPEPLHVDDRLSASSIRPSSGITSPRPTQAPRMSQMPSSGS